MEKCGKRRCSYNHYWPWYLIQGNGNLQTTAALVLRESPKVRSGPQNRSGRLREEKGILPLPGIEPRSPCRPSRSLISIMTQPSSITDRNFLIIFVVYFIERFVNYLWSATSSAAAEAGGKCRGGAR